MKNPLRNIMHILRTYDFKQAIPNIKAYGLKTFLENARRELTEGKAASVSVDDTPVIDDSNRQRGGFKESESYFNYLFDQNNSRDKAYVPLSSPNIPETDIKLIAFYLPQFHPIPENDEWWGKGFTEWTNVTRAVPQFIGHYQPRLPGEFGFYDLRLPEIQQRQIELARQYGIYGFCFHFYWFNGEKVLERPLEQFLENKEHDFPFCINWANESWSRTWDGRAKDVLLEQKHSPEDDIAFIAKVASLFKDHRYIRIDGKPLLVVYRPALFPNLLETSKRWREYCKNNGIGDIYLALTHAFEHVDPRTVGFDAAIEFAPNTFPLKPINEKIDFVNSSFGGIVYDYNSAIDYSKKYPLTDYKKFRSIFPGWDNEARRPGRGAIFHNASPQAYREWLDYLCSYTHENFQKSERLIFMNAWNEWAEGAYLEPDRRYGYACLAATAKALIDHHNTCHNARKIIYVSHDAHFHGAQLLSLHIVKMLRCTFGYDVSLLLKKGGQLESAFSEYAKVYNLEQDFKESEKRTRLISDLHAKGARIAICNSVVSGDIAETLAKVGIDVVTLVHELPDIIRQYKIENNAELLSLYSTRVIFPAEFVKEKFKAIVSLDDSKAVVLPQGMYNINRYKDRKGEAHKELRNGLSLPQDARIILGAGYADHRKGIDLFIEVAKKVTDSMQGTYFVWVGNRDSSLQQAIDKSIKKHALNDKVIFVRTKKDVSLYFAGADVYLLTSREDPFPSVVAEAMDVRVPVVGFDGAGGFKDIVTKDTGVLVPYLDIDAMSTEVIRILSDSQELERLGKNSSALVEHKLNFKNYVYELLSLLGLNYKKVSVIIPNYNYERYISERLRSVTRQTYPIYEIIFLDDLSSDNSLEVARRFAAEYRTDMKIYPNASNSGCAFKQWAKGIFLTEGDYIWIAEADDLCDPMFLEEVMKGFDHEGVVLSYSQSKQMNEQGAIIADNYLDYTNDVDRSKWLTDYVRDGSLEIAETLSVKNTIPNVSAVVFRKSPIDDILNELVSYKIAGDWLFYAWLLQRGKIAFCSRPLNIHRRHTRSVVAAENKKMHYDEVVRMQEHLMKLVPVDEQTKTKVYAYRDHVRKYLGIRDESREGQSTA